jgi:hypothetical protein
MSWVTPPYPWYLPATRDEGFGWLSTKGLVHVMTSVNEIDEAYYRISKSWRSLSRQDKQMALITLERLEAQADELGSAGTSVAAAIRALRGMIRLALE